MRFNGRSGEILQLSKMQSEHPEWIEERGQSELLILWFRDSGSVLKIDNVDYSFEKGQIACLTEFHNVRIASLGDIHLCKFNRAFYCILDHDQEVSCRGLLFFGASEVPVIKLEKDDIERFETLWRMFELEMESRDRLQIEMLQMMLKRLIILTTRLYKDQSDVDLEGKELDTVRQFNFLVETNFRKMHSVADYAELMHRSPKTLSNLFSQSVNKTPLQVIKDRIMLESRRLLVYTDRGISDIAYELGYDDVQSFSRFFRGQEGKSPTQYRESQ